MLLAPSALALELSSCLNITCGSTRASSENCAVFSGSMVTLNACPAGYICSYLRYMFSNPGAQNIYCDELDPDYNNPECSDIDDPQSAHGYCCQNSNCASNNCDIAHNSCVGVAKGYPCSSNEACGPGLYCYYGYCAKTKGKGESCEFDYECNAGYGCYDTESACIQYFSLKAGEMTMNDKFCKSGTVVNGVCNSVTISLGGKILKEPWHCTIGQNCSYTWATNDELGTGTFTSPCECDGKGSTTGYCPISDFPVVDFTDNFLEKFQYDKSDCSGEFAHIDSLEDRSGDNILPDILLNMLYCHSIDQDQYDYYFKMQNIINYWSLYASGQIDHCAKAMLIFDKSLSTNSMSFSEFLTFPGLLLIIN